MTDIAEFRGKSPDELKELAQSLKKELFNLRFQSAAGEGAGAGRRRIVKRDIARVKTLLNEPKDASGKTPSAAKKEAANAAERAKKKATKKKAGE